MDHPQSEIRNSKARGFTLIEIVITIMIVGIIAGTAALIIAEGARAYSDEADRSDAHYQARLSVERMVREIRAARQAGEIGTVALGVIAANPSNSLLFVDAAGTTVAFNLAGTTLNRTVGGVPAMLARGVTPLAFRFYDSAGALLAAPAASTAVWSVEVDVTVQQGAESLQVRTRVHPRNF